MVENWREWISRELERQLMPVEELEKKSGIKRATWYKWDSHSPSVWILEIVLNALGYTLEPVKVDPAKMARQMAQKLAGKEEPATETGKKPAKQAAKPAEKPEERRLTLEEWRRGGG